MTCRTPILRGGSSTIYSISLTLSFVVRYLRQQNRNNSNKTTKNNNHGIINHRFLLCALVSYLTTETTTK